MATGGIVESMLIGAAVGGGTSLATGNDPLKGALMGGITGGVTGGISGLGGSAGAAGSTSPLSSGSILNGAGTNVLAGGDPAKGLMMNASALASSPAGIPSLLTPSVPNAAMSSLDDAIGVAAKGAPAATPIPNPMQSIMGPGYESAAAGLTPQAAQAASQTVGQAVSQQVAQPSLLQEAKDWWGSLDKKEKLMYGIGGSMALNMLAERAAYKPYEEEEYKGPLSKFRYDPGRFRPSVPPTGPSYFADGGITSIGGGNIAVGGDPRRNPVPISEDNINPAGWQGRSYPTNMMADGGIASLGSYSDGGQLLRGPGDGMSDHIPAMIGRKQPARLADGEFVVPADVVSHLGNGSTDAGAKQLYAMMDKVRRARTGRSSQGKEINARKYLPA